MKLVYQYVAIFFNFETPSNHLHPQQVENCDINSRLVVDEDDNGKLRLERVKQIPCDIYPLGAEHDIIVFSRFIIRLKFKSLLLEMKCTTLAQRQRRWTNVVQRFYNFNITICKCFDLKLNKYG